MIDLIERSVWTGVQTGLGILTVDSLTTFDATAVEALAVAGVAAGLSALKTFSKHRLDALKESREV